MALTQVDQGLLSSTAQYTGFKNRIINGAMVIDQRGTAATPVTTGGYVTDRFTQGSPVVSKITASQSTTAPTGYSNSYYALVANAYTPAAGEVFRFAQKIEGLNCADLAFGSASAATVTLSFWVRSSVTGTYAVSLQNSAGNRSYVATYTVNAANTFEQKTITIAGDTSGTWLTTNGVGIQVAFCQQTGSTFQTTAGSWQAGEYFGVAGAASWLPTAGATMYITGVQLEKGSTATSFDYRPYGTELALCQRYYYSLLLFDATNSNSPGPVGWCESTTILYAYVGFPQLMRSTPSLTTSGTSSNYRVRGAVGSIACNGLPAIINPTSSNTWVQGQVASGLTVGQGGSLSGNASPAFLGFSSEL